MININNAVQFQHLLWDRIMVEAKTVVDATCGNGYDLLYLAERAQPDCHLYGIDIQEQAIESSRALLETHDMTNRIMITFLHSSHDVAFKKDIKEASIDLIVFNLGYLPGGDHRIMTKSHHTIAAIEQALPKLAKDGIITIAVYPGTDEGLQEKEDLESYLCKLNQKEYNNCHWKPINQINNPPELYMVQKR